MYDVNMVRPLFYIFFGLGFAAATLLGMTAAGAFILRRLWSLRDDLKDLKDCLAALEREEKED